MKVNPTQEFVKSIMSVLRLEQNIYTTGAIEKLIERLKVSDYQLFIAYLGERNSDYEKPIENIAKGVEEFYTKKLEPHRDEAKKKQSKIRDSLYNLSKCISKKLEDSFDDSNIVTDVNDKYKEQGEDTINYQVKTRTQEAIHDKRDKYFKDFCEKAESNNDILKSLIVSTTKSRVFDDEEIDIIIGVGLYSLLRNDDFWFNDLIFDYIFTKNIKPSVTNQITIKEYEKIYEPDVISDKTRRLLNPPKKLVPYSEFE